MTDLLRLLKFDPDLPARTVFKFLKFEAGPTDLADVASKTLIACTSRTGSSLLEECLREYGLNSAEHFNVNVAVKQACQSKQAATTREYANYLARTAVQDGRFAVKGSYVAFLFLYYMNETAALKTGWKIVHLRRRNIIRQAISMTIAAKTEQWRHDQPAAASVSVEDYSFDAIMKRLEVILLETQIWERIFVLLNLRPYRLFYEDFTNNMSHHSERVAVFLGLPVAAGSEPRPVAPRLKVQATQINADWERRFRQDMFQRAAAPPRRR